MLWIVLAFVSKVVGWIGEGRKGRRKEGRENERVGWIGEWRKEREGRKEEGREKRKG
jgi:hypothetical protein